MLILALDTTSRAGSVALARDAGVLDQQRGDPSRTHGERLPGDIGDLLERHGLTVADVDLYAVAAGPGSFTGLRVGIATIQGLALAHARPVVPVSALVALAHGALISSGGPVHDAELIAACMDAQRREVFSALYARSAMEKDRREQARGSATHAEFAELAEHAEHGKHVDVEETAAGLDVIEPPIVGRAEEMLGAWAGHFRGRTVCFVGDGALMCKQVLTECLKDAAQFIEPLPCLASSVALIAAERAAAGGAVMPHAIRPIYVRRPDAELARAARGLGEGGSIHNP